MPIYEFNCNQCNNVYELNLPISKRDEGLCPKCDSLDTYRSLDTGGVFKRSKYGYGGGDKSYGGGNDHPGRAGLGKNTGS